MAGGTIDLDEVAMPEVLDPRQVKGLHSGLCSRNVLSGARGLRQLRSRPRPVEHQSSANRLYAIECHWAKKSRTILASATMYGATALFCRHSGLAQASEKSDFEQGEGLWDQQIYGGGLQSGDA